MPAQHQIQHAAANQTGMTLDELAAFVQTAMRAGASGSEVVKPARTTWGGALRSVAVNVRPEASEES